MNTITIELCAEDRSRLDAILDALRFKNCDSCVASAMEMMKTAQESPKEPQEATKDETRQNIDRKSKDALEKAGATAPKPTAAADVKLSDIQGLVVKLATTGKKAEARDIVKAYAERVTEIPPEKYGEVFVKLKALGE